MSANALPTFAYHPDPLATGAIRASDARCRTCDESRGYIYTGPTYSLKELKDCLCPWCICTGVAADKFDAVFCDPSPLVAEGLSQEIVAEVSKRTPGFSTWQQQEWAVHCNDACEFHGDAAQADLTSLNDSQQSAFLEANEMDQHRWRKLLDDYTPGGDPAVYKFQCRHCSTLILRMDFA